MSRKNLIFFLACITTMLSTARCKKFEWPGTSKIGESCERDIQCIRHAFCKIQKTCLCETYYAPSLDMATCHGTVGAPCNDDDHRCETMTNAECRQNVCTCEDNFMIDINNSSNCIMRPRAPGDICQRPDECKETMEMALCINGKCACYTNHHFVNETGTSGRCIKMRGLYEPCKRDYECFQDEKHPNQLECKNGECACREGEDSCRNGSHTYQPIFLVFAAFTFGTIFRTVI